MSTTSKPVVLTAENFDPIVLQSDRLALVDFWAPWCGPCRVMNSVVSNLAAETADWLTVGKLDVDEWGELASRYRVQAIPTLIAFKNGEVLQRWSGVVRQADLHAILAEYRDAAPVA